MATVRGRPVLLACLVLALYGVVCYAGVAQHESRRPSLHRLSSSSSSSGGALQVDGRHEQDVAPPSSASHWRLLARRLSAVLRTMRSSKTAHASDDVLSAGMKPRRVRRSYTPAHQVAQQGDVAPEIERIERDAGELSDAEKLEQEEEIVRDVKQAEAQYGPAHKIAQQEEIAREIEEAENQARRADADRKFEQQREIQREIAEIERKAGIPSDAEKLGQEREIARQIKELEDQAKAHQVAQEQKVAADIHALITAHFGRKGRPDSSSNDASSSSEESQESGAVSNDVGDDSDSSSEESQESSAVSNDVDDDSDSLSEESQESSDASNDVDEAVYDDFFGRDSSSEVSPLDENDDDTNSLEDEPSSPGAAAVAQGHTQVAHSSWQVTAMTVIMCSIVGVVLLIVVGAWYRHLGPFKPGKPGHLLLEDDEQTVYHRTTQPEPRQVGRYSPLT